MKEVDPTLLALICALVILILGSLLYDNIREARVERMYMKTLDTYQKALELGVRDKQLEEILNECGKRQK